MGLCSPWGNTYLHNFKLGELGMIALKPTNLLIITGEIKKTDNLATTFHKPAGEENPHVRFGYFPKKMF